MAKKEQSALSEDLQMLVDRQHPLYTDNEEEWTFFYQAFKGGKHFLIEDNLFRHSLEGSTDYKNRLNRAFYINFVKKIVSAFTNFIYMEGVKRPDNPKLKSFIDNVDGKGGNMDSFIRKTSNLSSVFGHCNIFVEMPYVDRAFIDLATAKANGILPYATNITPLEMPDWSLDRLGKYEWCLIKKTVYRDSNPFTSRVEVDEYTLVTKEYQLIFSEKEGIIARKRVPKNTIPIIICNHGDADVDGFGESLISDIAYINRTIFNWSSIIDEMAEKQAFSQLVCPDDGSLEEMQHTALDENMVSPGEDAVLKRIGTSQIFTYPASAGHPPQFISPKVDSIEAIWKIIGDLINLMYLLTSIAGTREDMYSNSSKARQFIFSLVGNVLSAKAASLERTENAMYALYAKYLGFELQENDRAQYPKEFNVMTFAEYVEDMFSVIQKNISKTFNDRLKEKVVNKFESLVTSTDMKAIEKEISESPKYAIGDKQGNFVYKNENELFSDLATGKKEQGVFGNIQPSSRESSDEE